MVGEEVGLCQDCVVSLWLFNLFIDGIMREIRETAGEIVVRMINDRGKHEWITEWLLFADDTVLLLGDEEKSCKDW